MNQTILDAIRLSALAYRSRETVEASLHFGWNATLIRWFESEATDTQGFACVVGARAWVVLRGTELTSLDDWLTDLDCTFARGLWGEVHAGFCADAESIRGPLFRWVLEAYRSGRQVVFTGHSQGGALAEQLFAHFLGRHPSRTAKCISVGAPRSFSAEAAGNFGRIHGPKVIQVRHNNDLVCQLPPMALGYRHVWACQVRYIDRKGRVHERMIGWRLFWDRVAGYLRGLGRVQIDGLADHDIDTIAEIWQRQV